MITESNDAIGRIVKFEEIIGSHNLDEIAAKFRGPFGAHREAYKLAGEAAAKAIYYGRNTCEAGWAHKEVVNIAVLTVQGRFARYDGLNTSHSDMMTETAEALGGYTLLFPLTAIRERVIQNYYYNWRNGNFFSLSICGKLYFDCRRFLFFIVDSEEYETDQAATQEVYCLHKVIGTMDGADWEKPDSFDAVREGKIGKEFESFLAEIVMKAREARNRFATKLPPERDPRDFGQIKEQKT